MSSLSYNGCGICGYAPRNSMKDEANYAPERWWDPDDGWKIGTLCRHCREEQKHVEPKPEDYAYRRTNSVCDVEDTDENPISALEACDVGS